LTCGPMQSMLAYVFHVTSHGACLLKLLKRMCSWSGYDSHHHTTHAMLMHPEAAAVAYNKETLLLACAPM